MNRAYVVDIGNTAIKSALFYQGEIQDEIRLAHKNIADLTGFLSRFPEAPLIISSTADEALAVPEEALKSREVLYLGPDTPIPLNTSYDRTTLGRDRLANSVGANHLNSKAALVIDAGTCITYDYVFSGEHLGGNISPGWDMRLKAMHSFTGRLPMLEKEDSKLFRSLNTAQAMRSGAHLGLLLEIDGIINEFLSRYVQGSVYMTGGDAPLLAERVENVIFAAPFLTLKGLYEILNYNIK